MFWKSKKYYICWVSVCSISYPQCIARAPYYSVICGLSGCIIHFAHILINNKIFEKKTLLNIKFTFWLPLCLLSGAFLVLRRIRRDIVVNVHMDICKVSVILVRLFQLEVSRRIFEKYSRNKFHENPSSGTSVVPCGRTEDRDRHGEVYNRFL